MTKREFTTLAKIHNVDAISSACTFESRFIREIAPNVYIGKDDNGKMSTNSRYVVGTKDEMFYWLKVGGRV